MKMNFRCVHCGGEAITDKKLYKCPKCNTMQPIEDYKEAFEDLLEQYEEERQSAGAALRIMNQRNEAYRKERKLHIVAVWICFISSTVQWLRLL